MDALTEVTIVARTMELFAPDWNELFAKLIEKYRERKHPLEYKNLYQLLVMVMLSARDSDRHINSLAPSFFAAYPTLVDLSRATPTELQARLKGVANYLNKCEWLNATSRQIGSDDSIPLTLEGLVALPGIGRKSALVILREMKTPGQGIIVDLHVERVVPRLGLGQGSPPKLEKQLMKILSPSLWAEAGMAISFLGREICRPTKPKCTECIFEQACPYTRTL